jgi:hypothetical protein
MERTFTVTRAFLRRVLVNSGLNENSIALIVSQMEKGHRHMNVISLGTLLEKGGLDKDRISKLFRRLGMDDITIHDVISMMDEERINAEAGKVYDITLDTS